jgi:hypothetical protein
VLRPDGQPNYQHYANLYHLLDGSLRVQVAGGPDQTFPLNADTGFLYASRAVAGPADAPLRVTAGKFTVSSPLLTTTYGQINLDWTDGVFGRREPFGVRWAATPGSGATRYAFDLPAGVTFARDD